MLRVDVRDLRKGPVETVGAVSPGDPILEGLDLALDGPVEVAGKLEATGRGDYFWHGNLEGRIRCTCRRCLEEFVQPVTSRVEVLFSADPDLQDDPSVYPLAEPVQQVDVLVAVREELALSVNLFPLCREDCAGLCQRCGADLNQGPCGCLVPTQPA